MSEIPFTDPTPYVGLPPKPKFTDREWFQALDQFARVFAIRPGERVLMLTDPLLDTRVVDAVTGLARARGATVTQYMAPHTSLPGVPEAVKPIIEQADFVEWVELPWGEGYRSGTLWSELDRIASGGHSPLLEIETGGALAVRDRVPGAVTIFITAPSRDELEKRLRARATESEGEIDERLEIAERQLQHEGEFDHKIVNDDLERALDELEEIVRGELQGAGTIGAHDSSTR